MGASTHEKSNRLVFHYLLEQHARTTPDKPCLMMNDRVLSYAETEAEANRWARGLARRGVRKGDRVLMMIPSGIDHVLIWLGLCKLGALMVPVNEAYKGSMLRHQVRDSAATHRNRRPRASATLDRYRRRGAGPEATRALS